MILEQIKSEANKPPFSFAVGVNDTVNTTQLGIERMHV